MRSLPSGRESPLWPATKKAKRVLCVRCPSSYALLAAGVMVVPCGAGCVGAGVVVVVVV